MWIVNATTIQYKSRDVWHTHILFISPQQKIIYSDGRQAKYTWVKRKKEEEARVWPQFPSFTQRLDPDKSSSAFSKCKKQNPDCLEHTISIHEKRKMDPCTKNVRNAIRINLFYAEGKRRKCVCWGRGRRGGCNNCWNTWQNHMLCFWMTL